MEERTWARTTYETVSIVAKYDPMGRGKVVGEREKKRWRPTDVICVATKGAISRDFTATIIDLHSAEGPAVTYLICERASGHNL